MTPVLFLIPLKWASIYFPLTGQGAEGPKGEKVCKSETYSIHALSHIYEPTFFKYLHLVFTSYYFLICFLYSTENYI